MHSKFVVRPVREEDLDAFLELARISGGELTNISSDPEMARWRVEESGRSFGLRAEKPGSHRYLFFLEDLERGRIAGTCGIISKVGGFQPFYCYDLRGERFSHPPLGVDHEIQVLSPNLNYNGPSEICCLFLRPEYRRSGLGKLLSLSRFHFMGEFPQRFDRNVIAELRGVTNEKRESPFWQGVARHFFKMDFRRADFLSGLEDREFIANLMPKHPLYVPLLPKEAREAINRPHRQAEPALKMLLAEGFRFAGQIDMFDGGPIVEAEVEEIRTVRQRRKTSVAGIAGRLEKASSGEAGEGTPPGEPAVFLVSNCRMDFRCCITELNTDRGGGVVIGRAAADLLNLKEGDEIGFSPAGPVGSAATLPSSPERATL